MVEACAGCRSVLVVEDEATLRIPLCDYLETKGAKVTAAANGSEGIEALQRRDFDLVFTDVRMPGADGFAVMARAHEAASRPAVVVMTAYADVDGAVRALREGAFDFMVKPFSFAQVDGVLLRHCRLHKLERERDELRQELDDKAPVQHIASCSKPMQDLLDTLQRVAATDASVVLLGETGTGKELLADALHRQSRRHRGRLVKLNCAAIPEGLFESELFGHERGAFTGALARKRGKFEMADKGTLFLDEIGDLSLAGQAKLLRAIQERQFERVGGTESIAVDVRFVAASHRNLRELVQQGRFREDLFYRLSVVTLEVPPLRARRLDIEPLVQQMLQRAARFGLGKSLSVSAEAMELLKRYRYPGNVRELANVVERAATLCEGHVIAVRHLPPEVVCDPLTLALSGAPDSEFLPLAAATARFETDYIQAALRRTGERRGDAAKLLGISRKTLWSRLAEDAAEEELEREGAGEP